MSKRKVELYEEILPDGRCKYRMPYKDPLSGKKKTISLIMEKATASNYKLAKRTLEERLEIILLDTYPENISLSLCQSLYFAEKARTLKKSTLKRNEVSIRHICEWLGNDSLLNNLTVPYIKKTILEHSEHNYTYNEYMTRFKSMLRWAYNNDYLLDRNILDKLTYLPDDKKSRIEDKYLEKDELHQILEASESTPHWNYMIRFMVLSGLRVGEAIALKDSDIDSEYIHVRQTLQLSVDELSTPKTDASERDVYIRKELRTLINEIRLWQKKMKFERGIRSELFMCNAKGEHISYHTFNKYLRELSERIIGRRITTHALRHTAASLLIADGVPLETVSRMLGHEDSKITKSIYIHMTKTLQNRDNRLLENAKVL